nr:ATP-binding protein [Streptomyces turgidiscabies]
MVQPGAVLQLRVVERVAEELFANVVRHVPDRRCEWLLLRQSVRVRVEVADDSPRLPVVSAELSWESEGGRGLVLLDAMVAKWGVWPEAGGGKTAWFECRGDDSG